MTTNDSITLDISGMTCASCVRRVERALGKVPGVETASVNLATETARVTLAAPVEADSLIAAVTKAGYSATPSAACCSRFLRQRRNTPLRGIIWIGFLTFPGRKKPRTNWI